MELSNDFFFNFFKYMSEISGHYCYLLQSESYPNHTYIGYTNNLENRLRKHNGIIKGGAKATKKYSDWKYIKIVKFKAKHDALRFEWYWKHYKTKSGKWQRAKSGISNKINRLNSIKDDYECEIIFSQ